MAAATAVFTRGGKSGVREWEEKEHICKGCEKREVDAYKSEGEEKEKSLVRV